MMSELVEQVPATPDADGRRRRRERNRAGVIDALVALHAEGNLAPGTDEIAARAGLSPRSVFRYFDDVDDLCRAAIDYHLARAAPHVAITGLGEGPLGGRVERLVSQRLDLFETVAVGARVARLRAPFQPAVRAELTTSRAFLRRQVRQHFARELAAMAPAESSAVVAAVDALCSFETYDLMRTEQRLSRPKVAAALRVALTRLLEPSAEEA